MRAAALLGLIAVLIAHPALAWEPDAAAQARLADGRPVVLVGSEPGGVGVIRAAIEIAAPPQTIWDVVVDCSLAPKMVADLKSCRVLDRDPAGRWDLREHISRAFPLPPVRSVFRSDYDPPRRVRMKKAGGEMRVLEGEWRLEPRGDKTLVIYENRVALPFAVPPPIARAGLRRAVPKALLALNREVMARR